MTTQTRGRALSLTALVALALLSGCSSQAPVPAESSAPMDGPTASAEPQIPVGTEFTLVEGDTPLNEDVRYTWFTAAGSVWAVDPAQETTLHWTHNGTTWTSTDLTTHGLPAEASLRAGTTYCSTEPVIDDRGDSFTVVYYTYNGESHPQGILDSMWLVDVEAGAVTVTAGADVGLERMPAPEGDLTFRTSCGISFADVNGQRALIGQGQWWKPFSTGKSNVFVATEATDGTWSVHSSRASEFLGGDQAIRLVDVVNAGGNLVAVVGDPYLEPSFEVWTSSDGKDWVHHPDAFAGAVAVGDATDVRATPLGVTVVGVVMDGSDGEGVLWSSPDGREWTSTPVSGGGLFEAGTVLELGDRYLVPFRAYNGEAYEVSVWELTAPGEWVLHPDSHLFSSQIVSARSLGAGLVVIARGELRTSGDPWN